jgi:putative SOS response-associated peptidase YedK
MPVIIDRLAATHWLDPAVSHPGILSILLQPLPSELMAAYEVSKLVNDPRNDSAACITPADWKAPGPLFETSS